MKFVLAVLVAFVAVCAAQPTIPTLPPNFPSFNVTTNSTDNSTVIPPPVFPSLQSTLALQLATCPLRDQIRFLNQILSVEYISQAYYNGLIHQMDQLNSNASVDLGTPAGAGSASDIKANVTLILNQVNQVISWLNDTITQQCAQLPADDRAECYVYARCNYTFGNLTNNWPNNTVVPSNSSSNVSSSSNSTSSLSSYADPAFRQATVFSDTDSQFMIAVVPLMTNSTQQQQLTYFSVMHGQHAAYFRKLTGGTQFVMAPIVTDSANANLFRRSSIRSGLLPFIQDQSCCDGFRGVRRS